MTNVTPIRPQEVVCDPPDELLEQFEDRAREYFRCALESAVEKTWRDARHLSRGSMSVDTLARIVGRAIEAESARFRQ